jgi:hypothetical protein
MQGEYADRHGVNTPFHQVGVHEKIPVAITLYSHRTAAISKEWLVSLKSTHANTFPHKPSHSTNAEFCQVFDRL